MKSFGELVSKLEQEFATPIIVAVNESSLSRVWSQVTKFESGTISAFRSAKDCNEGVKYSKSDNKKRSAVLKAKLLSMKYGVTPIKGVYIYNYGKSDAKQVPEDSYLVVDMHETGNLKRDLMKLGKEFEQDSITYSKPNGDYYLISTNECKNGYPGEGKIGVSVKLGKSLFGKKGEFHSRVNGRPFIFTECTNDISLLENQHPTHIRSIIELSKKVIS